MQNTISTKRFVPLALSESVKIDNLWQKSFLQIMMTEVLKICEKWYLLMQKLIKETRNGRSGGSILHIFIRHTFKTWNTIQKGHVFFILFWLVLYPFWYIHIYMNERISWKHETNSSLNVFHPLFHPYAYVTKAHAILSCSFHKKLGQYCISR